MKTPDWADKIAAKQIYFTNVKNYPQPVNGQHGNRLVGPDECSMDINEEEHRELKALRAWFAKHLRAAYRKGRRTEKEVLLKDLETSPAFNDARGVSTGRLQGYTIAAMFRAGRKRDAK